MRITLVIDIEIVYMVNKFSNIKQHQVQQRIMVSLFTLDTKIVSDNWFRKREVV